MTGGGGRVIRVIRVLLTSQDATGHFRGGDDSGAEAEAGAEAEMTRRRRREDQEEGQDTERDGAGQAMESPGAAAAREGRSLGRSGGSHFLVM
jgi:hypothetical protein